MANPIHDQSATSKPDAEMASKITDVLASVGIFVTFSVPVPPSIVKSIRKATERIIGGVTDYGMTFLEDAISRRKSITNGRELVAHRAAENVAERIEGNAPLMDKALQIFAADFIPKQANKENILNLAMHELGSVKSLGNPAQIIDDDWLADFSEFAGRKSDKSVQLIFAKILAGEIQRPGSFSPLTLHILSTLTRDIAGTFERFCNLCVAWQPDTAERPIAFLPHRPYPSFLEKGIEEYDISYGDLLCLQNYGLLFHKFDVGISESAITETTIEIGERRYQLRSKTAMPVAVSIRPVAPLSIPGAELRKIISLEVPSDHLARQIEYFGSLGFDVIEL